MGCKMPDGDGTDRFEQEDVKAQRSTGQTDASQTAGQKITLFLTYPKEKQSSSINALRIFPQLKPEGLLTGGDSVHAPLADSRKEENQYHGGQRQPSRM